MTTAGSARCRRDVLFPSLYANLLSGPASSFAHLLRYHRHLHRLPGAYLTLHCCLLLLRALLPAAGTHTCRACARLLLPACRSAAAQHRTLLNARARVRCGAVSTSPSACLHLLPTTSYAPRHAPCHACHLYLTTSSACLLYHLPPPLTFRISPATFFSTLIPPSSFVYIFSSLPLGERISVAITGGGVAAGGGGGGALLAPRHLAAPPLSSSF